MCCDTAKTTYSAMVAAPIGVGTAAGGAPGAAAPEMAGPVTSMAGAAGGQLPGGAPEQMAMPGAPPVYLPVVERRRPAAPGTVTGTQTAPLTVTPAGEEKSVLEQAKEFYLAYYAELSAPELAAEERRYQSIRREYEAQHQGELWTWRAPGVWRVQSWALGCVLAIQTLRLQKGARL